MTLLAISNAVADDTHGPRPASIAGNTNPDAQNILRIINKVGTRLMRVYPWSDLREEHAFTASGNEIVLTSANVPSDFDRFVPETFWDRDGNNLLSGPISAVEWNGLKVQTFSSQHKKFIRRGSDILTNPVFDSGTNLAFEYVSKNWCDIAAGSGEKSAFTVDSDVALIDEELITLAATWEWLSGKGQPRAAAAFQSFKDYFETLQRNDAASENIAVTADIFAMHSRHFEGSPQASRTGDF